MCFKSTTKSICDSCLCNYLFSGNVIEYLIVCISSKLFKCLSAAIISHPNPGGLLRFFTEPYTTTNRLLIDSLACFVASVINKKAHIMLEDNRVRSITTRVNTALHSLSF